jgi:hypothetical protein
MVQSAKDSDCGDVADPVSASEKRRVFVQRQMRAHPVVVRGASLQHAAQIRLSEHHHTIECPPQKLLRRLETRESKTNLEGEHEP